MTMIFVPGFISPASAAEREASFTNSLDMSFVMVPAGSFDMGSPEGDEDARGDEKPLHRVTISRPFFIGQCEVTQEQWEEVMGANPYDTERSNMFIHIPGMEGRLRHPENPATVSWEDAQEFISRLNEREGHALYRLPTEAEWEYAARAGTATRYSFGDSDDDLERYAWYGEGFTFGSTHPVGTKQPNPWGMYDVHGNVWEWVQDRYDAGYYAVSPAVDPQGPESGTKHAVRGGSWHASADSWRSAFRKAYPPDYRGISIGFRLVREIEVSTP